MYRNTASTCDRHFAKHLRGVMGNRVSKNIKVFKVNYDSQHAQSTHMCDCGKLASFHLVAEREEKE